MKDFLAQMADYNAKANEAFLGALSKAPAGLVERDQKVYYKSILGTYAHIVAAELLWLGRYRAFFPNATLERSPLFGPGAEARKAAASASLPSCAALCAEVDGLFGEFVRGLDEAELAKRVAYRNSRGEELERFYWQTIFQVLNHGTHHRGEISAMLDQNGVANDLAGFTQYMK